MKMLLISAVFAAGLLPTFGVHAQPAAAGVSATCKDGSSYSGTSKRGACSGHGGVKQWAAAAAAVAKSTPAPMAKPTPMAKPMAAPAAAPMAASAASTATCKDGSSYSGASKRGACSGHGGVKTWSAAAAPMAAPAPMAKPMAAPKPAPAAPIAAAVSATCKDGSSYSGASKRGACSGHGGVQVWDNVPASAAPIATAPAATPKPIAPAPRIAMPTQAAAGGGPGMVWVNTSSKVYHCSNDRWYGKTKRGAYMSEGDAKAKGNHAEHGKSCS